MLSNTNRNLSSEIQDLDWHAIWNDSSSFVAFKQPYSTQVEILGSSCKWIAIHRQAIKLQEDGFIICPFQTQEQHVWYTKPDFSYATSLEALWEEVPEKPLNKVKTDKPAWQHSLAENKENYLKKVSLAKDCIALGNFTKVVLARSESMSFENEVDLKKLFLTLSLAYPHAFVYLLKWDDDVCWFGASPELIMYADQEQFRTQALAGTQAISKTGGAGEIYWSEKEIEEQALVARYIVDCFKKIRVREYVETGPTTTLAGNLAHLKSDFVVKKAEAKYPDIEWDMLELLHPTSAVCGMPKQEALHFLHQIEQLDRKFYSGYLGPVKPKHGATSLFVNLRSATLRKNEVTFFAGAGITSKSDPEAEWRETEAKIATLKKVFDNLKA